MPNLERLSLADLDQLNTLLQTLAAAGHVLQHRGLTPVFDLGPCGQPAIILPAVTMPYAYEADEDDSPAPPCDDAPYAWSPGTGVVPIGRNPFPPSPPAPLRDSAAAAETAVASPADDAPAAVAHDAAAGVAPEEITDLSEAAPPPAAEDGPAGAPAEATADAQPAAAEAPATHSEPAAPEQTAPPLADTRPEGDGAQAGGGGGMAAAPAANHGTGLAGRTWTAEEDQALIEAAGRALAEGKSFTAATNAAGPVINRSGRACFLRAKKFENRIRAFAHKLKVSAGTPQDDGAEAETNAAPDDDLETAPADPPAPAPRKVTAVSRHVDMLGRLTAGRRWSHDEDIAPLESAVRGLKPVEIAVDMGINAGPIKHRLAVLVDAFDPAAVLAELQLRAAAAEA